MNVYPLHRNEPMSSIDEHCKDADGLLKCEQDASIEILSEVASRWEGIVAAPPADQGSAKASGLLRSRPRLRIEM